MAAELRKMDAFSDVARILVESIQPVDLASRYQYSLPGGMK